MSNDSVFRYPFVFFVALLITYVLTPLVLKGAFWAGIVDKPSPGRINTRIVPRSGGLAVFAGFHLACFLVFYVFDMPDPGAAHDAIGMEWWKGFLLASSMICFVGFIDDIYDIKPLVKLFGQVMAATLMFMYDVRMGDILGLNLPMLLDYAMTVAWFVGIVNAFNLIDGLDGLCTGLAIIGAAGIAGALVFLKRPDDAIVLIAFIGACLAFLRYNFHPARIFLGDAGSMFLGFTLAAVGLSVGTKGATVASIGVPLLAVGVPIFDTMLAIWRRSVRRLTPKPSSTSGDAESGVMSRDLDHLHHRLLRGFGTHRSVAAILYAASACLVGLGLMSMAFSSQAAGLFLIAFVVGSYVIVRHVANIELWDSGRLVLQGIRRPNKTVLAVLLYPLADFFLLSGSLFVAVWFSHLNLRMMAVRSVWLSSIPLWCAIPFFMLFLARTYSRVWSRARISEFFVLGVAVLSGVLVSWGIALMLNSGSTHELSLQAILFLYLSTVFILSLRVFPRITFDLMSMNTGTRASNDDGVMDVLVVGAGANGILCLRQLGADLIENGVRTNIVGLVDNDRNLRKRYVHGYQVFGGIEDLPQVVRQHHLERIILTEDLTAFDRQFLFDLARRNDIEVTRWSCGIEPVGAPRAPQVDQRIEAIAANGTNGPIGVYAQ